MTVHLITMTDKNSDKGTLYIHCEERKKEAQVSYHHISSVVQECLSPVVDFKDVTKNEYILNKNSITHLR